MNRRLAILAACLLAACSKSGAGDASGDGAPPPGYGPQGNAQYGGGAAPAPRGMRPLPPGAIRVQQVAIVDQNGFAQPMPASYGLIPAGWGARGGVLWGRQFACTNGYNFDWTASSPDQAFQIGLIPQMRWEANNYGAPASGIGCPTMQITGARQLLEFTASRFKPGARLLDYRDRPDLSRRFWYLNMRTPSPLGEMRYWVEAGELLFAYQENGRDMRGVLATVVTFQAMTTQMAPGQTMVAVSGGSFPGFYATAPSGQLDLRLVEAIRQSFVPNPAWQAELFKHNSAISAGARAENEKRAKIWAETNDYISRLRAETQAVRDRSDERISRERGEVIRGVETYQDADAPGGRVELSSYYDHAWRMNDGSYLLSTDPNFDPWRDAGVEARKLEPLR